MGKKSKEELIDFYQSASFFVLPSLQESYGIVLVEALSFGLPLISTKLIPSGSDYINQNGLTGFVVPPKDPYSIAKSILQIQKNYSYFSQNAKKRYEDFFTKEKMILSLYEAYKKCFEGFIL